MPALAQLAASAACYPRIVWLVACIAEDLKVRVEETGEGEEISGERLDHLSLSLYVPSFHLEKVGGKAMCSSFNVED